jgi:hypothetical protein
MSEQNLIHAMGISKKELYGKFKDYEDGLKDLREEDKMRIADAVASVVFNVPIENKPALFFMVFGMTVMREQIDFAKQGGKIE